MIDFDKITYLSRSDITHAKWAIMAVANTNWFSIIRRSIVNIKWVGIGMESTINTKDTIIKYVKTNITITKTTTPKDTQHIAYLVLNKLVNFATDKANYYLMCYIKTNIPMVSTNTKVRHMALIPTLKATINFTCHLWLTTRLKSYLANDLIIVMTLFC